MAMPARLLLVDDDETTREALGRRLLRAGHQVDMAEDGFQALEMLRTASYDLVLLDYMMPGLSGPEVLRRIRLAKSVSELPVIMVTALDDSEHMVAALREGANDYVTKPLNIAVAMARIEAQLRLVFADRELRRAKELYQLASRASEDGLWDWNLTDATLYYSAGWKSMLGYEDDEISDTPEEWLGRLHPDDRSRVLEQIQLHPESAAGGFECEYRIRHKDGRYRWMANRGRASRDSGGRSTRISGCQSDITARKTVDSLTSLPNRFWLSEELGSAAAGGRESALLLLDLDGFERVEQNFSGGGAGRLLAAVGAQLGEALRASPGGRRAAVARSGEHQFGVLLRDVAGPAAAVELAGWLQAAIREPFSVDGEATFATVTAGIAMVFPGAPEDEPLRDANAAIRRARTHGPGCTEVFQAAMRERERDEMRLQNDLRRALASAELVVYYQPKVRLATNAVEGFEALVRWNRPGHGLVPPDSFIGAAERTGLIVPLGRFVLERACRDIAELRRDYPGVWVSVNVSGRQLAECDLVEQVRDCLDRAGLETSALHLEVTETFLVEDPEKALSILTRLRGMGVGLKLDDFGSGYASFDYLQRFPFDSVKIDRSFVARLPSSRESAEIVRAIAGLSRSLNMTVVAEGIETREQLEWLKELGCPYGQGYLFSKPLDLARLKDFLAQWPQPGNGATPGMEMAGLPAEKG